jgi:hypothetical protein
MPEQLYEAYARKRGTKEWQPVTDGGLKYYADKSNMTLRLSQMSNYFVGNEYMMKPVEVQHG